MGEALEDAQVDEAIVADVHLESRRQVRGRWGSCSPGPCPTPVCAGRR